MYSSNLPTFVGSIENHKNVEEETLTGMVFELEDALFAVIIPRQFDYYVHRFGQPFLVFLCQLGPPAVAGPRRPASIFLQLPLCSDLLVRVEPRESAASVATGLLRGCLDPCREVAALGLTRVRCCCVRGAEDERQERELAAANHGYASYVVLLGRR